MKDIKRPALTRLKGSAISIFQTSGRRHLLLTGSRGIGKTTLFDALLEGAAVPGVRSYVKRGADGLPREVILEERTGARRCVIGRRTGAGMEPDRKALDGVGAELLRSARLSPCAWAAVDEIGFLEEAGGRYGEELLRLFEEKRMLAVLRKADTPLLLALRGRGDALVLDLDGAEEWLKPG